MSTRQSPKPTPASRAAEALQTKESGVIACLVNHGGEKLPPMLSRLLERSPDSFDDQRYGRISRVVFRVRRDGKEASPLHVRKELLDAGEPELGALALQLLDEDLPVALAELDAADLWPAYQARRARTLLSEAAAAAEANPDSVPDLLRRLPVEFAALADGMAGPGSLPDITDASEFLAEPIPAPAELVAGVIHRGSKLAFGGSSKSFKTWCLLDLAVSVATGANWLGFPTVKGEVLFVNFEIQSHAWQRRVAAVATTKGLRLEPGELHVWNLRGHAADFRVLVPKLIARARREGFALIVLDPIYKLYGGTDENAAGDVASFSIRLSNWRPKLRQLSFSAHTSPKATLPGRKPLTVSAERSLRPRSGQPAHFYQARGRRCFYRRTYPAQLRACRAFRRPLAVSTYGPRRRLGPGQAQTSWRTEGRAPARGLAQTAPSKRTFRQRMASPRRRKWSVQKDVFPAPPGASNCGKNHGKRHKRKLAAGDTQKMKVVP
jgi:hypothetical protein